MPAFDDIKELTCPCLIPETLINMLGPAISEEPYGTLQKIIAARIKDDLEAEYALSTKTLVESSRKRSEQIKRSNAFWKLLASIQFVESIKVDNVEWFFFKCSYGTTDPDSKWDSLQAILLKYEGGKYLQAVAENRETNTKLNYVYSAFITGSWKENGKPSSKEASDNTFTNVPNAQH